MAFEVCCDEANLDESRFVVGVRDNLTGNPCFRSALRHRRRACS